MSKENAAPVAIAVGPVPAQPPVSQSKGNAAPTSSCRVAFYLALNLASSIATVGSNKVVFRTYNFQFGTLLTFIHFIATFLGLEICRWFGLFEFKRLSILKVFPLSLCFCGFVVLTNLSLVYNTVGFYQLAKMATTPVLVVMQWTIFGEHISLQTGLSLAVSCVGVTIGTVTDTTANFYGTLFALTALIVTALYQIMIGRKQKELDCDPYQLLYYQAPLSAMLLIPVIPLLDQGVNRAPEIITVKAAISIGVSCCCAFLVNVSIFQVIGKTSAITYHVLGYLKLICILAMGILAFDSSFDVRVAGGTLLMLIGVFWYTKIKIGGSK